MKNILAIADVIIFTTTCITVASQSLPCRTANGDNCTSVICPNTVVNYTCTITSGTAAGFTDWILPTGTCPTNTLPDKIRLFQLVSGACASLGPSMCGPYTAFSIRSSDPTYCLSSILTVNITSTMNGSTVTCSNTNSGNPAMTTVVSSATINVVASPGPAKSFIVAYTSLNLLTVTWAPPTTGGIPTSYNVSINGSSPVVIADNGSSLYTYTFTRLINDTFYTVSVVAINCAGTSSVTTAMKQTLAFPPNSSSIYATSIFNPDGALRELEITWTPVGGSVTIYGVYVGGVLHGNTRCTTSPCFNVVPVCGPSTSYAISVASINGGGIGPMSGTVSNNVLNNDVISSTVSNTTSSSATVSCSFLNSQSFYCVVCCNTDPSVPPDSSVPYISTTSDTMVTVTLQGLTSGQMYYCKAKAANTNTLNCGGPVVGGVKTFFNFKTPSIPVITSQPTMTSSLPVTTSQPTMTSSLTQASIDTPTAVGISVAITFIISFSLGSLVTAIVICGCYIPRVSSVTHESVLPATTYEVVGINQKKIITAIELESNAAYGTAR